MHCGVSSSPTPPEAVFTKAAASAAALPSLTNALAIQHQMRANRSGAEVQPD